VLVTISIAALCTLGVAFYVRFLIALCKECRHHCICYLVRLESSSLEHTTPDGRVLNPSIQRAA
jgi:hypothetical protein